jgi:hypothetical protein
MIRRIVRIAMRPAAKMARFPILHEWISSLYLVVFVGGLASVAQLAEQLICNQQVVGSSPSASSERGGDGIA